MKYIKCTLSDNTEVKFKIRKLVPYGLDIAWKYTKCINFTKYIDLHVLKCQMEDKIKYLQQLSDEELISRYVGSIEDAHIELQNTKRVI